MMNFLFLIIFAKFIIATTADIDVGKPVSELELKLVHVVFRHGIRTSSDTFPKDPNINETYKPYGKGELTNIGKTQMFELGEFLRNRYDGFLSQQLKLNEIHAQSTDMNRSKMSLQLVLAGLFPPKNTALEWNKNLNWQPIPFNFQNLFKDTLLLVTKSCPRYHEELERVLKEDVNEELDKYAIMFEELSNYTGWNVKSPLYVQHLHGILKAQQEFGLELPEWTKEYFPHKMQELVERAHIYNSFNEELKKLKGGVFVKKALEDWNRKVQGKLKEKIFVYSGHDASVVNILSAFNAWEQQFPDYGVTAILEFSQHVKTKEYGVEIFLRNSTLVEPYKLQIDGCGKFCTLSELEKVLRNNMPQNWTLECKAKNSTFTKGNSDL